MKKLIAAAILIFALTTSVNALAQEATTCHKTECCKDKSCKDNKECKKDCTNKKECKKCCKSADTEKETMKN